MLHPFSERWGLDRGGSIDRYYIDPFVRAAIAGKHGRFLEFGYPTYRRYVEPGNISQYDILDIDRENPEANIIADVESLSSASIGKFDVIICTQVLQYVQHPARAINVMHELLKPSGLLVLSVPFIAKDEGSICDRWRFSCRSIKDLLESFAAVQVSVGGNLFASICFLLGLGMDDIAIEDLEPVDLNHYNVVLATASK